jgi:hypothetical protein
LELVGGAPDPVSAARVSTAQITAALKAGPPPRRPAQGQGDPDRPAQQAARPAGGGGHRAALRQLGNRLVGILHGCLKTNTVYDETTAWEHHHQHLQAVA